MKDSFVNKIFQKDIAFQQLAQQTFLYQYKYNSVYRQWCDLINTDIHKIKSLQSIPFLPISFFKTHKVICNDESYETIFESSGTTQTLKSKHYLRDTSIYTESFCRCFNIFYGDVKDWCILGLLPSYLQQNNSSLVAMVDKLIQDSNNVQSGFYLNEYDKLKDVLQQLEHQQKKTLLIGVTYALLDFAEQFPMTLKYTTVMETGGMKGRRKELTRNEVHDILKAKFNINDVHSEYGMTELLSQAYSKQDGKFYCAPWMKVVVRNDEDPFNINETGKGIINIVDLANYYSCAFIATDDAGEVFNDGSFAVYGRIDNSDIRGCSLLSI